MLASTDLKKFGDKTLMSMICSRFYLDSFFRERFQLIHGHGKNVHLQFKLKFDRQKLTVKKTVILDKEMSLNFFLIRKLKSPKQEEKT